MKKLIFAACLCMLSVSFNSCKKNQPEPFYEATATIKTGDDGSCFFQIDDDNALVSSNDNFKTNPYKKELRVHMFYYDRGEATKPSWNNTPTWKKGEISALDTILTKKPVPAGGEYGKAKIELINTWMNSIEDGYMTLMFEGWFGGTGTIHYINLERTENPLAFKLKHDDQGESTLYRSAGLVAFDIHDLPVPNTGEFDVILYYSGYLNDKAVAFHYKDGKYARPERIDVNGYIDTNVE